MCGVDLEFGPRDLSLDWCARRAAVSQRCSQQSHTPATRLTQRDAGLDAENALAIMQLLADFAAGSAKRTIVCAIHQPRSSIFNMFNQA